MIQLVVTDLDGTLLTDDKQLPSDFWKIELELRNAGIVFAVASGRPYISMRGIFETIQEHVLFISENGAYINYRNNDVLSKPMLRSDVEALIKLARAQEGAHILLCGKDQMYYESDNASFWEECNKYYSHMTKVDDVLDVKEDILKFTICDLLSAEENCLPKFKHLKDRFSIAVSGRVWLDITDNGTNKGTAIEHMQQLLGIKSENTIAFGDYFNDIQMLERAGKSYAMKNAHPEVIKIAKKTTQFDNNEGGVTKELATILAQLRTEGWKF